MSVDLVTALGVAWLVIAIGTVLAVASAWWERRQRPPTEEPPDP